MVPDLINGLRRRIEELEQTVADLTRQNEQLREAVTALLSPDKVPTDGLTRWRDR
jgi:cell division protein FtsL